MIMVMTTSTLQLEFNIFPSFIKMTTANIQYCNAGMALAANLLFSNGLNL